MALSVSSTPLLIVPPLDHFKDLGTTHVTVWPLRHPSRPQVTQVLLFSTSFFGPPGGYYQNLHTRFAGQRCRRRWHKFRIRKLAAHTAMQYSTVFVASE